MKAIQIFATIASLVVFAVPAVATESTWGGVGIGQLGASGNAMGQNSAHGAHHATQIDCQGGCQKITTFRNTCGAMARGTKGSFGWGVAPIQMDAELNAVASCLMFGSDCTVTTSTCSR